MTATATSSPVLARSVRTPVPSDVPAIGDPETGAPCFSGVNMARTVAAIEAQMSATTIRRLAAKAAINRRRGDATRAQADVLSYHHQVEALTAELEELFDERARAQMAEQIAALSEGRTLTA